MLIVLDNAESILDPKATGAKEIHSVVDELCQFKTISLCITSRITTVPPRCKRPEIPALSMKAACDIFCSTYGDTRQTSTINNLLQRLDFHALSIKLLATAASHNLWDHDRLAEEWEARRAQVLQADYNESLAATIELSLSSPTFQSLGPDARDLLGVVAFFPQGVNEKNLNWLFPTISNGKSVLDKFCALSLTYRNNGFITMLAPIRDYLSPKDPQSSPLLCTTRDHYFTRLSVDVAPSKPGFEDSRWIVLEDVNVEYLLDVLTSVDQAGSDNWEASFHFMEHLYWHKQRQTILGSKIKALSDDHKFKSRCLFELSRLLGQLGHLTEAKELLKHALELERRRGDDVRVGQTLQLLSVVNQYPGFTKEGIQEAREALEIFERIHDTKRKAICLDNLAWSLYNDNQLDAAEDAASRAINLISERGQEHLLCRIHQVLGLTYQFKGEKEKAIQHLKAVLEIASSFNWAYILVRTYRFLAEVFYNEGELDEANAHIEQDKSYVIDEPHTLGWTMHQQARVWRQQGRIEDAKTEILHALEIFEELGIAGEVGRSRALLEAIERDWETSLLTSSG